MPSRRQTRLQNSERDGRIADTFMDGRGRTAEDSVFDMPESFDYSHLRYQCAECGAKEDLQQCARCKKVKYCGRECQVAAYRRIHKAVCNKPTQVGYPSMELIEQADFNTLASMLDEWGGSDSILCITVAHRIILSQSMDSASAIRIAKTTARLLNSVEDLESPTGRRTVLEPLILAKALVLGGNLDDDVIYSISSTPLLAACTRLFLAFASRLADCEFMPEPKSHKTVGPFQIVLGVFALLSATPRVTIPREDLVKCANAAAKSISDCVQAQGEARRIKSSYSKLSDENKAKVFYAQCIVQKNIISGLRMLLASLTSKGFAPQSMQIVTAAFLSEASARSDDDEETPQDFLKMWASIASHLEGVCGVDATELKNAILSFGMTRYGIAVRFGA